MDYTTVSRVKSALKIESTGADALLATLVTAASRAIDRYCTGTSLSDSTDYFGLESVTAELVRGVVDAQGYLHVWPHKAEIASVSALSYRFTPLEDYIAIETDYIVADGPQVIAYSGGSTPSAGWGTQGIKQRGRPWVQISYSGGLAADTADLPADLIEAATVLTARYYREDESGLTDAIGVAEIGQLVYTQAMPKRVMMMLQPYRRVNPW